jgi:glycosyltransferase involved in cell wall biosynthesis
MSAKPHILVVHELLYGQGGAEAIVLSLAKELSGQYRFSLLYERVGNETADWDGAYSQQYQMIFREATKEQVYRIVAQDSIDLVLVHKCTSKALLEHLLSLSVPLIHWQHDHETWCMRGYKYSPWTRKICNKKAGPCCLFPCGAFIKRDRKSSLGVGYESYFEKKQLIRTDQKSAAHIVCSEYMREEMIRQGYNKELIYRVPFVPERKTVPLLRQPDGKTILFFGQVVRGKGLDILIQALKNIEEPWELVVVGSGTHEEECRRLVHSYALEQQVHFKGFLPFPEVVPYFSRTVCLAMPSMWGEPFGLVGIEAMRAQVPVVGFASGGMKDWLHDGENGLVAPWGDVRALRNCLRKMLTQPELVRQLGEIGKEQASQYEAKKAISSLSDIFSSFMR